MRSVRKRSQEDLIRCHDRDAQLHVGKNDGTSTSTAHHHQQQQEQQQQQQDGSSFAFGGGLLANCLTRELHNLPSDGQTQVTQDILGISPTTTNTPSFEAHVYQDLEEQIHLLPEKAAYTMAEEQSYDYVHDTSFQIMFLRATCGDVKRAAKRMVRHFKTKLDLFGPDKLVQRITLDDFDDEDMEALRSGGFQILSKRDRAGRSVLFGRYTAFRYKKPEQMLRTLWYLWMTLLEDETNQIKGVTAVGYEIGRNPLERYDNYQDAGDFNSNFEMLSSRDGSHGGFDRELAKQITTIPLSVPVRPVSYHLCTDSDQWVATLNMVVATICKFMRLRMRLHHGSDQECKYQLMTHGFPADAIPVLEDGSLDLTNHLEWIEHRRAMEAQLHT